MAKEGQIENPIRWLTRFLTKFDKDNPDIQSDFSTPEVMRMQLYHRTIGDRFKIAEAHKFADRIAGVLWSNNRKSRVEAVAGLQSMGEEKTPMPVEELETVEIRPPEIGLRNRHRGEKR